MISHKTFLFLVSLLNISCSYHVIVYNTFLFFVTLLNISCDSHVTGHKTFSIFSNIQRAFTHDLKITSFDWLI